MQITKIIWPKLWLPILFLLAMWVVECVEQILGVSFGRLGILPRDIRGIQGIIFAPFLHGEWAHILSNSLPFIILSSILFLTYRKVGYLVFISIYLLTGLFVWLLARGGTYHIGASGLVYGIFGFIFFSGIFRKDIKSIGISLIVAFFYGGMVFGIFPKQPGISWESHLLGMLLGASLAFIFKSNDKPIEPKWMEEPEQKRSFEDFIEKINKQGKSS